MRSCRNAQQTNYSPKFLSQRAQALTNYSGERVKTEKSQPKSRRLKLLPQLQGTRTKFALDSHQESKGSLINCTHYERDYSVSRRLETLNSIRPSDAANPLKQRILRSMIKK